MEALKIIKQDDDTAVIGGYGVIFGGVDLEGETFTKDTDFMLDLVPNKPVFLDHSQGTWVEIEKDGKTEDFFLAGIDAPVGKVQTVKPDDTGLYMELLLEKGNQYWPIVEAVIGTGKAGLSSGTIGHLARREGSIVKRWPIVEESITLTPAEPRTIERLERLKKLAEANPDLRAVFSEAARTTAGAVTEQGTDAKTVSESITTGDTTMSEEQGATASEPADMTPEIDAIKAHQADQDAKLDKILAALEQEPPPKPPAVKVTGDEADRAAQGNPFKSFGEFLFAVKDVPYGQVDKRLLPARSRDALDEGGFSINKAMGHRFVGTLSEAKATKAAPTGLGESSGPAGGYLVDSDRAPGILSRVYEVGELLQRVSIDPVGPNANGMTYFKEAESSRATGSRRGGVRFYWLAENSAITASNPTFDLLELKLKKAGGLVYATDELLADMTALESYVMRILPEELRWGVEDSIINGLGTGQPLGILNSNATVSVAKETGQAAATLVAENVIKMWSRLWGRSQRNAVWLINQDVQPQLYQLSLPVGTGGQLVFTPPGGLSASPYGTLFGRPVIVHESCATLGTVGDILLVDPMEYQMIEKGGIESASSIHVRFTQGEQVFRFTWRIDGQPAWDTALTPANGSNTQSPFISLATRS